MTAVGSYRSGGMPGSEGWVLGVMEEVRNAVNEGMNCRIVIVHFNNIEDE